MNSRLVVLSSAVQGREVEFEQWYDNVHLRDIVAIEGVVSARRMRVENTPGSGSGLRWRSLAIYEFAAAPEDVLRRISEQKTSGAMEISPALDRGSVVKMIATETGIYSFGCGDR